MPPLHLPSRAARIAAPFTFWMAFSFIATVQEGAEPAWVGYAVAAVLVAVQLVALRLWLTWLGGRRVARRGWLGTRVLELDRIHASTRVGWKTTVVTPVLCYRDRHGRAWRLHDRMFARTQFWDDEPQALARFVDAVSQGIREARCAAGAEVAPVEEAVPETGVPGPLGRTAGP